MLAARGDDLAALLEISSAVRDAGLLAAGRPGVVTFSKKVFIPLTRLCRDRCHYCTFATVPHRLESLFLERDEVVAIAREGAAQGCKEALFTLGDRPEDRWPQAAQWLNERGYGTTLDYVRACAIAVLEETGLLPHLNPGVLSWEELQRLRPVAPSMGMMLETTATRLWSEPGGPHYGSPDKEPALRLRVLEDAGRVGVPFTTGILIGIGETLEERAESIFAIRRVAREYGHIQETIIQNFRAKPDTAMRSAPDALVTELAATVAVARLVLGPKARIQAPPNLIGGDFALLLAAGIDDWGGVSPVTPDHVNPERPWPVIEQLAAHSAEAGFELRERLTVYPSYVQDAERWIDPRLFSFVSALALPSGLADESAKPVGMAWQEPEELVAIGRTSLHAEIDTVGRTGDRRADFDTIYGDWSAVASAAAAGTPVAGASAAAGGSTGADVSLGGELDDEELGAARGARVPAGPLAAGFPSGDHVKFGEPDVITSHDHVWFGQSDVISSASLLSRPAAGSSRGVTEQDHTFLGDNGVIKGHDQAIFGENGAISSALIEAALARAADDPASLLLPEYEEQALALLASDGEVLDRLAGIADVLRAKVVGDEVTYVVNRNINFSNVCYVGCRFCAFAQRERDADAYRLSVDQVVERAVEAWDLGATEVCIQSGIDPKLPVSVYPDLVRAIKSRLPEMHVHAYSPMEVVTAAAKAGVSVREWLTGLRDAGLSTIPGTAAEILDDEVRWVLTKGKLPTAQWIDVVSTAHELGIRSSATMMFGHVDNPGHWLTHFRVLAGIQDRTGGFTEFVALPFVHTNAPIYLAGIARAGASWRENRVIHAMARILLHGRIDNIQCSWVKLGDEGTRMMLQGGCNDLGGTLMEETISRMAGSEFGSARTVEQLHAIAAAAGRPAAQRTTTYGRVGPAMARAIV
nr:5-amino-6-(D-ribitylamino)uracil--L-tyrosine 4-hydroxyphenyl transferase CofH [Allocatelliglobosispora scoriae]